MNSLDPSSTGPAFPGPAPAALDLRPGDTLAVLGAPGAGKTALLRRLAGLEPCLDPQDLDGGKTLDPQRRYLSLRGRSLEELPALAAGVQVLLLDDLPDGILPRLAALRPVLPPALAYAAVRLVDALPGLSPATRVVALSGGRVLLDLPIAALAGETPCYCLRIGGALDPARAAWFDGLAVLPWGEATLLAGPIPDQPALFGLLARIRDLGLPLVELRLLPSGPAELLALLLAG